VFVPNSHQLKEQKFMSNLPKQSAALPSGRPTAHPRRLSRRHLLGTGLFAASTAGVLVFPTLVQHSDAQMSKGNKGDIDILNNALFYEHQAIWAYGAAAGKLTSTNVGKAVLAIALRNQSDHKNHRDLLASAVSSLGGKPVGPEASYDVSAYIKRGEGNLDSDVNIAKLALALEVDAAIAYTKEIAMLKTPALITAGATIGENEATHATAIRAAFQSLGVQLMVVPAAFVAENSRDNWILKV
jgi:rubrerythrin